MSLALKLHPEWHCDAATRVEVELARTQPTGLALHYLVWGRVGELRLPPVATPERVDGLWQHTCFEAFIQAPSSIAYYEFNVAPSKQWAAYRFEGYRRGMHIADEFHAPRIDIRANSTCYELILLLELGALRDLPGDTSWRVGLSAVIEEASGNRSYWALEHPRGKPDFHHPECFAHEIAAGK